VNVSQGMDGQGAAWRGGAGRGWARTLLSWWRLRECFGLAWLGEARLGEAGRGKDSFELVADSVNVKAGHGLAGSGEARQGLAGQGLF